MVAFTMVTIIRMKLTGVRALCIGLLVVLVFGFVVIDSNSQENEKSINNSGYNGCCSFPCRNRGICMDLPQNGFLCDCVNTGYYGKYCQRPYWKTWFINLIRPTPETTHSVVSASFPRFWNILNSFYSIRSFIMKVVLKVRIDILDIPPLYSGMNNFPTLDAIYNYSVYARVLPPVPLDCPTPMGTKGPKELPPIDDVVEQVFRRKKFQPCHLKTNVLFAAYAQHFTHMFLKTDLQKGPIFTWGHQNVDMTNIYGNDKQTENQLRSFQNGELKMQIVNGEEYPVFTDQAKVNMANPKNLTRVFAMGHAFFNALPTLAMFSTVFMREHNRVAKLLSATYPNWEDERIFQTTKLIILGETLKITVEDYVQHLSNYPIRLLFDPEILHNEQLQYQNRIHVEFNLLYHWHPLMPDSISINDQKFTMTDWLYDSAKLLDIGFKPLVEALVNTSAGMVTARNHGNETLHIAKLLMKHSRELRLQPFNEYRKRYNLKPFTTFLELTGGNQELANVLKNLYQHVDAVELYPGLLAEKRRSKAIFGSTIVEMGSPSSLQGLFGNMFSSPKLWRPSTFGGDIGFNIVKSATLKNLFCNNMPGECPRISFKTEGENTDVMADDEQPHGNDEL